MQLRWNRLLRSVLLGSLACCSQRVTGNDASDGFGMDTESSRADTSSWDSELQPDVSGADGGVAGDRVEIADRPVIVPPERFARIDVIRTPRGSLEANSVEAWIVVPQRPDGTGYRAERSGDCVVENLTYPPFDRFADRFFFTTGIDEREVTFRDINQTMRWSAQDQPFMNVGEMSFRAVRADFAVPWTFTASIPPPVLNFTSPVGIEQFPMPALNLRLTDTVVFRWTPTARSPLVQIQFQTYIVNQAPLPYIVSKLRCVYDGLIGTALIRLADHPTWRSPPNFRSGVVLDVDALAQHIVPYGDIMVEVNMMHRHGAFGVTIVPSP